MLNLFTKLHLLTQRDSGQTMAEWSPAATPRRV